MTSTTAPGERLIDRFLPQADVRERHETLVRAPADVVFDVAWNFDLWSIPLVRAIFWLRATFLGAAKPPRDLFSRGLVAEIFGAGIVLIRWLLLPALRREAERTARA